MLYALDEINKNKTLLPGIKIGYDIRDTCNSVELAAQYALSYIVDEDYYVGGKSNLVGVIGGARSSVSTLVNNILSTEYIPQISYSASSAALSTSWKYPSFLRTVPSDTHQATAIVDLVRFFGWSYVSAFAIDDDYGRVGLEELQAAVKKAGLCLAHARLFNESMQDRELEIIREHLAELSSENTHIVILWAPYNEASKIMRTAARKSNNTEPLTNIVFIGTEKWTENENILSANFQYRTIVVELDQPLLENSFLRKMSKDLVLNWQNPWFRSVYKFGCPGYIFYDPRRKPLDCYFPLDSNMVSAVIKGFRKKYPQVIAAVYALAFGLHEYLGCDSGKCNTNLTDGIDYEKLYHIVKKCDFIVPGSESYHISFDPATSEIVDKQYLFNLYRGKKRSQFGRWLGPQNITSNRSLIDWGPEGKPFGRCSVDCLPGTYRYNGSSPCCWKCPACPEDTISTGVNHYRCRRCLPEAEVASENKTFCVKLKEVRIVLDNYIGLMLLASCVAGVLLILFIILVFARFWDTPVVKSSSREISIIQLLSLMLMFCMPVLYFFPLTPLICMSRTLVFGFCFTTVISIILVKTYRLIRVFGERFSKVSRFLRNKYQIIFIYALVVFELIAVLLFNWNFPPEIARVVRAAQLIFYVTCDDKQIIIFWIVMLYIFILTIVSGYYAFRARKLPENYNEAQYISLSMFTAIVIWVAYVPLFFSLSPHDNNVAFLFQNFVCTLSITVIMYSYKIYVILFKPRLNSPEHARQQHKDHFMSSFHNDQWRRQNTPEARPRLASLPVLPVAVHHPSEFDEPDAGATNEKTRLQPRRASFSSMSQLEKIQVRKTYDTFLPVKREMRKSQSTSFLLDSLTPTPKSIPRSATSHIHLPHIHLPHFPDFKKVLSNISINRLLDHRKSETRSLLGSSDEMNTRL